MDIFLKNTLSGKKEVFKSIKKGEVGMYNCGPTVYDKAHIGNLRSYIFADLLKRLFVYQGYKVNQVINITDVGHLTSDADEGEDKLEKSAREKGQKATEIVLKYTKYFMDSIKKVNIDTSTIRFVKATDHIKEQIELIKKLEKVGLTYNTPDGIYYDTSKFEKYGKLGNIDIKGLQEGSRIKANPNKKNPTDFALWKFSRKDENREQEWNSPWGIGFPGWHLECSAMSVKYLGQPFDIHTGGIDHIPIHHNNEIAQSEGAYGKAQANYWLHHNHILLNKQKISKSLGNTIYIEDIEKMDINPLSYRYWLLTSHYSTLTNFTNKAIGAADVALKKIINKFAEVKAGKIKSDTAKNYLQKIIKELTNDLGTAEAIATTWEMIRDKTIESEEKLSILLEADKIFGLDLKNQIAKVKKTTNDIPPVILDLANKRNQARNEKNFIKADELRAKIKKEGFEILDKAGGFELKKI